MQFRKHIYNIRTSDTTYVLCRSYYFVVEMKEDFKMKVLYCVILTSLAIIQLTFMSMCFVINQRLQQLQQNRQLIRYIVMKKKILCKTAGRSCWVNKGQAIAWWYKLLTNEVPKFEWRDNIHMSKRSFMNYLIC